MAITDASAIAFSNNWVRPMADKLAQRYYLAKEIVAQWNAQSMGTLFTNDTSAVVDGSPADGRGAITGADVNNLITRCMEIITDYEATSSAKLNTILKPSVNPKP